MYEKNLDRNINLRMSAIDYDFLVDLADKRNIKVSELCRYIIGEYRRSMKIYELIKENEELSEEL